MRWNRTNLNPANRDRAYPPRTSWARRALFQVHLWTGLLAGLYLVVVCLTGSAIVFRHEMSLALCPRIVTVTPSGARLSDAQIAAAARRAGPGRLPRLAPADTRIEVRGARVPGAAVEVWFVTPRGRLERLFDPYTGRDLGEAIACEPPFVSRVADLHDNLLGGFTGRLVNGIGGLLLSLMCLTGAVIWWPGTGRWRRRLTLRRHVPWRRFVWDLHGVVGFWAFALIFLWAISAAYFAFPNAFNTAGEFLVAHSGGRVTSPAVDAAFEGLAMLHFGRAFGPWIKVLWVVVGLAPVALLGTGALMWWHRVRRVSGGGSDKVRPRPARLV